jgi:ribosomal protein S18 acetylase RimI-like enzyme
MNRSRASEREADRCMPLEINLLDPRDWPVLRSVRLAALRDSPGAFVATLAVESERTSEEWIASIERSTWVVARNGNEVVGIACLTAAEPHAPRERFIESVWVTPQHRRRGLVRRMLQRLEDKARADGADYLQLWVLETNESAYDAYLKLDFYAVPDTTQDSSKSRDDGSFVQERFDGQASIVRERRPD